MPSYKHVKVFVNGKPIEDHTEINPFDHVDAEEENHIDNLLDDLECLLNDESDESKSE